MAYKFQLGSAILSGTMKVEETLNAASGFELAGAAVTATAAELNILDGATVTAAELNVLDGLAQGSILLGDGDGAAATLDVSTSGQIIVGNGTTGVSVPVSGDATLAADGALTIANDAVQAAMLNDDVISGQTELASGSLDAADEILISDGGVIKRFGVDSLAKDSGALTTEAAITVADDYVLFLDGGATGETKKEQFSDIMTAIAGSGLTATNGVLSTSGNSVTTFGDSDSTLAVGVNVYSGSPPAVSRAYTLPTGSDLSNGDVIRVKAGDLSTNSVTASIQCQGTDKIEGVLTQIDLESPAAAVTIIYTGNGFFAVF